MTLQQQLDAAQEETATALRIAGLAMQKGNVWTKCSTDLMRTITAGVASGQITNGIADEMVLILATAYDQSAELTNVMRPLVEQQARHR